MGAYKVTSFIIALLVFSGIASILGIFIAHIGTEYTPTDYAENADKLDSYNKLNELSSNVKDIQDSTTEIKEKTGILDVIGGFFSDAYRTLLITKNSFDVYNDMSDMAFNDASLGEGGNILRLMLGSIIIVCIFVGVLLSALVKKDL